MLNACSTENAEPDNKNIELWGFQHDDACFEAFVGIWQSPTAPNKPSLTLALYPDRTGYWEARQNIRHSPERVTIEWMLCAAGRINVRRDLGTIPSHTIAMELEFVSPTELHLVRNGAGMHTLERLTKRVSLK